jgi:hypothetical protein
VGGTGEATPTVSGCRYGGSGSYLLPGSGLLGGLTDCFRLQARPVGGAIALSGLASICGIVAFCGQETEGAALALNPKSVSMFAAFGTLAAPVLHYHPSPHPGETGAAPRDSTP